MGEREKREGGQEDGRGKESNKTRTRSVTKNAIVRKIFSVGVLVCH